RPFTANGPYGASNWSLSSERALAARTQMLRGGMPAGSVLQVMGMADAALVDSAQPLSATNRRVELLVTTEEHARGVAATFGKPGRTEPLTPGVLSSAADTPILKSLRAVLLGRQESRQEGRQETPTAP
ncbi:MAG TPA: histidine kinase, partial [Rhizobacter sp.]|nr:histidine kinase [Rhizobacter sp.]